MHLYHFTATNLTELIITHDLRLGHLDTHVGKTFHGVTWLTSYPFPDGTGVPMKETNMTEKELAHAARVQGQMPKNNISLDKSRIRIQIEAELLQPFSVVNGHLQGLIGYEEWCELIEAPKDWAKYIGVTASFNVSEMSREEVAHQMMQKGNTREGTWYLHFGPISSELFERVDCQVDGDYVKYDFEVHGRADMERVGNACFSSEFNAQLAQVIRPLHELELPKALVFCSDPAEPPEVTVRGGGVTCRFDAESGKVLTLVGERSDFPLEEVRTWVLNNRAESLRCWERAVESYYRYYPNEMAI